MNPSLLKGLIGVGVIGGAAGLAIGGYNLLKTPNPTTLKEKFERENVQILDYWTEDISKNAEDESYVSWFEKEEKYRNERDQSKKFDGLDIDSSESFEPLRAKCKEVLEKSISETKGLESKVKQWCTLISEEE